MSRTGRVERTTKESSVLVAIDLDGQGSSTISTGVPFYDHMLAQLAKHGGFNLEVHTEGDLEVDAHHTVEDTALALGTAFRQALGDGSGLRRFGDAMVPLDEALAQVAVEQRAWRIERVDGLPPATVSPDPALARMQASATLGEMAWLAGNRSRAATLYAEAAASAEVLTEPMPLDPLVRARLERDLRNQR